MTQVSSTITIYARADAIWQAISNFEAAGDYLAGVVDCAMEGEGVGALRTLTSADGSTIVERLEALDEAARRMSYALLFEDPQLPLDTTWQYTYGISIPRVSPWLPWPGSESYPFALAVVIRV